MHRASRMAWMAGAMLVVTTGAMLFEGGAGVAYAQRVEGDRAAAEGIYQTEVSVHSQSEAERNVGFARAMIQVLSRLTGNRSPSGFPGVGQTLRNARQYVDSYDYRQDEGISPTTGAPTYDTTLIVRFDQDKVDNMVAALGLPLWPQPRPKPVLWLAIDDGHGPRLVGLPQASAARSVLDHAVDRGFKLGLPNGSAAEQAAVGAIWRGDTAAVARLSSHYSPPMQLIGKLYRSDAGWTADWTFVDSGRVLSNWTSEEHDARRAMAAGADGAADALVRRYAKASEIGTAGTYRVTFTGVDSGEDFMRLAGYLEGMPVVRRVIPVRATPEGLEVDLDLTTGLTGFRRLVDGNVLEDQEGDPPVFRLH
jgi:hypothetical protein